MKEINMPAGEQRGWIKDQMKAFEKRTGMRVCHIGLSGSSLHGTWDEASDIDLQGYFVPTIADLVLRENLEPVKLECEDLNIEMSLRSITDLYGLIEKASTDTIDSLFAPEDSYMHTTRVFTEFAANRKEYVSTELKGVLGYIRTHCETWSNKVQRMGTLRKVLEVVKGSNAEYVKDLPVELFSINGVTFEPNGKHSLVTVLDKSFNLKCTVQDVDLSITKKLASYGRRMALTEANGYDSKALSHIVRIAYMAEEILTTGNVIYPMEEKKAEHCYRIKRSVMDDVTLKLTMDWLNEKAETIDLLVKRNPVGLMDKPNTKLALETVTGIIK